MYLVSAEHKFRKVTSEPGSSCGAIMLQLNRSVYELSDIRYERVIENASEFVA